jgi:(2Fe-2S) ferredoxin
LSLPPAHAAVSASGRRLAASERVFRGFMAARESSRSASSARTPVSFAIRVPLARLGAHALDEVAAARKGRVPLMPFRQRYLLVCTNRRPDGHPKGSCAEKGSEQLVPRLKELLARLGVAGEVRACSTSCLDLCEIGATVIQEPEHVAYGRVTLQEVEAIADAAARGDVVTRLVVHPRRGEEPGGAA